MSDWDLMMPGMGLSAIGLAGVILSYLGIANTFLTGMQALSGLTLFVGLIFLSAGMLSGGISTSPRAKATTLVIFGIAGSVGVYAISLNKVITSLPLFVGILIMILIPTIVIAFAAMKTPKYFKPIAVIFVLASLTAITSYTVFGFVGPGAQFSFHTPGNNVTQTAASNATTTASTAPVITINIPLNSSQQGSPNFTPALATVPKGDIIQWTNNDKVPHTVTSAPDGSAWDSGIIAAGKSYQLDTSKLNATEYDYLCTVHPFMTGKIIITSPAKPVFANVTIAAGAATQATSQKYFDPPQISVKTGTTVVWTNKDSVAHTVTSGDPNAGPSGAFDSNLIKPGNTFNHEFDSVGTTPYFCTVHPWMTGKVTVG